MMTNTLPKPTNFKEALKVWVKIAIYSFGGPTNQIAVMHRLLVEEKRWVSQRRFLHALNYCMLLPGPEAHQLVIYMGWLFHKYRGGIIAGSLFVLPGFLSILFLSVLYAKYQEMNLVQGLFYGLKPAVIAIVFVALFKISQKTLSNAFRVVIAGFSFIGMFFLKLPFPLIILFAGLIGFFIGKLYPHLLSFSAQEEDTAEDRLLSQKPVHLLNTVTVALIWIIIWLGPTILLIALFGSQNIFAQEGIFFSKVAAISIGGAYSVLAYVAQQAVQTYHWLKPGEMLDGLGMAETTPGPLIQVVQFVGFMAAFRNPGNLDPLMAGILASIITAWATFVPSFLWIFVGAPYIEKLRHNQTLNTTLSGITAAVVGVILNLALWFALNTLFPHSADRTYAFIHIFVPQWSSFQLGSFFIAITSFILLTRYKAGLFTTFAFSVALGLIINALNITY